MRGSGLGLAALVALAGGCMLDSQHFVRRPDGSYTMSVRTWTFGMNTSVAGMKSDWQTEDALYGDSVTNANMQVETRLVEAVAEGVVRGMARSTGGGIP